MRAKKIFDEKRSINALPIVSEDNTLIGDYTRWDDFRWLDNQVNICKGGYNIEGWFDGQTIAFVQSNNIIKTKLKLDNILKEQLAKQNVEAHYMNFREALQRLEDFDILLFNDENEIRAFETLLYLTLGRVYEGKCKLTTHSNILSSDKYLNALINQGVGLVGLVTRDSEYSHKMAEALCNKFKNVNEEMWRGVIPKSTYKDFFDDLYDEEYIAGVTSIRAKGFENNRGINRLKDWESKYYNVMNGERCTVGQPKEYINSIYFVGQCYILGNFADDSHTMESMLQNRICQDGYMVRVVNCGCWGMDYYHIIARIASMKIKRGDIIIIDRPPEGIEGVLYIDLNEILEKNNVHNSLLTLKIYFISFILLFSSP